MQFAERMKSLGTETAFLVLAKAKALEAKGQEIIHLEIGEPDFNTPPNIVIAAIKALREGQTHYSPAPGIPILREAITENARKWRNIKVTPASVVVAPGAKPILFFAIQALINPGDEVIYPNPGYPIYESVIRFNGGSPVPLHLKEENDFGFFISDLEKLITSKTRMLILNSPHNPTGSVLSAEILEKVAHLVRGKKIWVLSDEVYKEILFEGAFTSIASFPGMPEQTIILDGFSKSYAMTGWRIGYGIMPPLLAEQITKLAINCYSCTATFIQYAALEALTGPQDDVIKMVSQFNERRNIIYEGLNRIEGLRCVKPKGAFYIFPNISRLPLSSPELESYLLEAAGVASLSGSAFGKFGNGYLRFSCANSIENINKALLRIEAVIEKAREYKTSN